MCSYARMDRHCAAVVVAGINKYARFVKELRLNGGPHRSGIERTFGLTVTHEKPANESCSLLSAVYGTRIRSFSGESKRMYVSVMTKQRRALRIVQHTSSTQQWGECKLSLICFSRRGKTVFAAIAFCIVLDRRRSFFLRRGGSGEVMDEPEVRLLVCAFLLGSLLVS